MRGPAFRSLASDGRATLCAQTRKEQHRPDRVSSRRPFERRMRVPCRLLSVLLGLLLAAFSGQAQVQAKPLPLGWQSFEVPDFGTRVDYPARIFGPSGETRRGVGQRFESPDHRATLSIYATDNDAGRNAGHVSAKISAPIRPRLPVGHAIVLCHFNGTGRADLLQPLQFLAWLEGSNPL